MCLTLNLKLNFIFVKYFLYLESKHAVGKEDILLRQYNILLLEQLIDRRGVLEHGVLDVGFRLVDPVRSCTDLVHITEPFKQFVEFGYSWNSFDLI